MQLRSRRGWRGTRRERQYEISTFDSESFELEINGRAWDTSGLSFVQISARQLLPETLIMICPRHRTSGRYRARIKNTPRAVSAPLTSYYPAAPLGALEGMLDAPLQEVSSDSFSSGS